MGYNDEQYIVDYDRAIREGDHYEASYLREQFEFFSGGVKMKHAWKSWKAKQRSEKFNGMSKKISSLEQQNREKDAKIATLEKKIEAARAESRGKNTGAPFQ